MLTRWASNAGPSLGERRMEIIGLDASNARPRIRASFPRTPMVIANWTKAMTPVIGRRVQQPLTLRYIAVDGPIGSGKTTLARMLAQDLGGSLCLEPSGKNPFLPDFYDDRKKNAFKTQLYFLLSRHQQQLELKQRDLFSPLIICDYTFAKDFIFAATNLSEDELKLYNTVFRLLKEQLPRPDLVIYLRAESNIPLSRIKKRGIDYKQSISEDYLDLLTDGYSRYFLDYDETPLLVVDTSNQNYAENPEDFANLKREILSHRGGTAHFIARA